MSEFKFSSLHELDQNEALAHGFYLCVLHADKIPPHIGCLIDGLFYSLKVNGKDEQLPVNQLLKAILRKKVPTVFVQVDTPESTRQVAEIYERYQKIEVGESTCLSPLVQLFKCEDSVYKLSQLLEHLNHGGRIKKVFKVHLTDEFTAIAAYSLEEIEQRLVYLSDVKRR